MWRINNKSNSIDKDELEEIKNALRAVRIELYQSKDIEIDELIRTLKFVNAIGIKLLKEKSDLLAKGGSDERVNVLYEALTMVIDTRRQILNLLAKSLSKKDPIDEVKLMTFVDVLNIIQRGIGDAEDKLKTWIRNTMNGIVSDKPTVEVGVDLEKGISALELALK